MPAFKELPHKKRLDHLKLRKFEERYTENFLAALHSESGSTATFGIVAVVLQDYESADFSGL